MKGISKKCNYFKYFLIIPLFVFLSACVGLSPINPINPAIVEQSLTIQPGPVEGKDSTVWTYVSDANFGDGIDLWIGGSIPDIKRSYLQFDLSTLPADAVILSADLKLYQYETSGMGDLTVDLHKVTDNWIESTIAWNNQPNYSSPESTISVRVGLVTWLSWDITSLLQGWLNGEIPNYGVVLKDTDEPLANITSCHSSDYLENPALRPKLEITYYVP